MSSIVEKQFNASQKIDRSIFRGSPNLMTTDDLNWQIAALKYQLAKLEEKTGPIIEGANIGAGLSGSVLSVLPEYDDIIIQGCNFQPARTTLTYTFTGRETVYLVLVADKKTVTYSDDSAHTIAGAKFADGTSQPAADKIVYENEQFLLVQHLDDRDDIVAFIASYKKQNDKLVVRENYSSMYDPLLMKAGNSTIGAAFEPTGVSAFPVVSGDSYDDAFAKIVGYLGKGVSYQGVWMLHHASTEEVSQSEVNSRTANVIFRVFGPFVFATLTVDASQDDLNDFFIGPYVKDALLSIFISPHANVPQSCYPTTFLGSMVGDTGLYFQTPEIMAHCINVGCASIVYSGSNGMYCGPISVNITNSDAINEAGSSAQIIGGRASITLMFLRAVGSIF